MTQKHFQALADAIYYECCNDEERKRMAEAIGNVCAEFGKNFNQGRSFTKNRFRAACFGNKEQPR